MTDRTRPKIEFPRCCGRRVYAVALRDDLALQTAAGRDERLAGASTVGRLDRAADRDWAAHGSMVDGRDQGGLSPERPEKQLRQLL